ncbi:MAG TPA: hypothetical protein EYQ21_07160 [Flavobacteriales bacterium]|jgi:hypothetical protein|nr:hypothetical protein [Flavobacteriales bacterium]
MGMDVNGINPVSEEGVYFRANVWGWRPLHLLLNHLADDLIDEETMHGMSGNDGCGVKDHDTCCIIADRITIWLENNTDGIELEDSSCRVYKKAEESGGHRFAPEDEDRSLTMSAYKIGDEHIAEFVTFLRCCGGFAVC